MITKPSKAHYHCRIGELVKDEYTYKEAFEMVEKEYLGLLKFIYSKITGSL